LKGVFGNFGVSRAPLGWVAPSPMSNEIKAEEREGQSSCKLDLKAIEKAKGERLMLIVQAVRSSSALRLERCQTFHL